MCRQKSRLETGQRAKYLTQASGFKGFWSWAALAWVRGSQGYSGRKGPQQVVGAAQPPTQSRSSPFAICLCLSLVLLHHSWLWGLSCSRCSQVPAVVYPRWGRCFLSWVMRSSTGLRGGTRHAGGRIAFSHCLKHFATSMTSNCFAVFSSLNNGDYCFFKILHNLVSLLIQFEYIYVFTRSVLQNIVETLFPSGCPQRSVGGTKRSDKQTWSKRQPFIWMWGWQRACLWISDGELPLQEPVLLLGHVTSQQTATFFWLISWY